MIDGYTKIYNLGDVRIRGLFTWPVSVEEKVDGSQFSFMKDEEGVVHFRSKRVPVYAEEPSMFQAGCLAILERKDLLNPGWVYRGEYLSKPKHNTLAYERIPEGHVILWDVQLERQTYEPYALVKHEAERLGLEAVPELISERVLDGPEELKDLLEKTSVLGGQKIEGVVIKARGRLNADGKLLAGKWVSEAFKEVNQKSFKERNPGTGQILETLATRYRCESRWRKAVQRLRDDGTLTNTPKDIGPLVREIQSDIQAECAEEMKDLLFKWAWKKIAKKTVGGFPQWYKEELIKVAFDEEEGEQVI